MAISNPCTVLILQKGGYTIEQEAMMKGEIGVEEEIDVDGRGHPGDSQWNSIMWSWEKLELLTLRRNRFFHLMSSLLCGEDLRIFYEMF